MIKDHQVQGVVYHVLRGCLVYDFEYQTLEDELGKLGVPVIRVKKVITTKKILNNYGSGLKPSLS